MPGGGRLRIRRRRPGPPAGLGAAGDEADAAVGGHGSRPLPGRPCRGRPATGSGRCQLSARPDAPGGDLVHVPDHRARRQGPDARHRHAGTPAHRDHRRRRGRGAALADGPARARLAAADPAGRAPAARQAPRPVVGHADAAGPAAVLVAAGPGLRHPPVVAAGIVAPGGGPPDPGAPARAAGTPGDPLPPHRRAMAAPRNGMPRSRWKPGRCAGRRSASGCSR